MPHKDQNSKRNYMREYIKRRKLQDDEFRKKLNVATVKSRQSPEGKKKHTEANARYRERHPDRVKTTMLLLVE